MRLIAPLALCLVSSVVVAQSRYTGPIVDVHVHTTTTDDRIRELQENRVARAVVFGRSSSVDDWQARLKGLVIPSLALPCLATAQGELPCYPGGGELPDVEWVRAQLEAGRLRAFGELLQQYAGMAPTDARLEPYFALAEELDVPVGIHLSLAPPRTPERRRAFRTYLGKPQLLEDVLAKHPKLRVYVMHAGYPYAEEMKALLYMYPQVYVDISAIAMPNFLPRGVFHEYLRGLVDVGFHDRIMFGSDYPGAVSTTIEAIESAPFLTLDQKRDIFCGNAVRFFALDGVDCS